MSVKATTEEHLGFTGQGWALQPMPWPCWSSGNKAAACIERTGDARNEF